MKNKVTAIFTVDHFDAVIVRENRGAKRYKLTAWSNFRLGCLHLPSSLVELGDRTLVKYATPDQSDNPE